MKGSVKRTRRGEKNRSLHCQWSSISRSARSVMQLADSFRVEISGVVGYLHNVGEIGLGIDPAIVDDLARLFAPTCHELRGCATRQQSCDAQQQNRPITVMCHLVPIPSLASRR